MPYLISILTGFLGAVPNIVILIATIMYVSKRSTPEAYLMLIGGITGLLTSLFYSVGMPLLTRDGGGWESYQYYVTAISAIGGIGSLSFAIGLVLLVRRAIA